MVVGNAEKMVMRWLLARCRGEKMVLRELAVVMQEMVVFWFALGGCHG